jgi:putative transposase
VQYACNAYQKRLETRNIAASMSRVGNPYDNAKAESFMKTLKSEEVDAKTYLDLDDARRQIGAFIETVYNTERLHSALGYKPPAVWRGRACGRGRRGAGIDPKLVYDWWALYRRMG